MDHLKIEELAWLYQLLYLLFFYLQLLGYNVSTWKEKDRYRHTEREQGSAVVVPTGCRMSTSSWATRKRLWDSHFLELIIKRLYKDGSAPLAPSSRHRHNCKPPPPNRSIEKHTQRVKKEERIKTLVRSLSGPIRSGLLTRNRLSVRPTPTPTPPPVACFTHIYF